MPVNGADLNRMVEQLQAATGRAGTLLLEIDSDIQRRAAEAQFLTGRSAEVWQQCCQRMLELWTAFQETSEKVQSWVAQMAAGRLSRDVRETITRELLESSAEESVRSLLERVEHTAEGLTSIWAVRDVALPELAGIDEQLRAAEGEAAAGRVRLPNEATRVRDELDRMRHEVGRDPLAMPPSALSQLAARGRAVRELVRAERERLDGAVPDLERIARELDQVVTVVERIEVEREAALHKIAGARPVGSGELRAEADRLRSELARAMSGAGDRRAAAGAAERIGPRVALLREEAEAARAAVSSSLARRQELRGRLEAYRAKAVGTGRAEDFELSDLYEAAAEVLYSSPCDLDDAEQRVAAYQWCLLRTAGRERA